MTHVVDAYVRNLERILLSSIFNHHRIMGGNYFTREYGDKQENVKYELKYSMFRDSITTYLRNKILEYVNVIPLHSKVTFPQLTHSLTHSLTYSLTHLLTPL